MMMKNNPRVHYDDKMQRSHFACIKRQKMVPNPSHISAFTTSCLLVICLLPKPVALNFKVKIHKADLKSERSDSLFSQGNHHLSTLYFPFESTFLNWRLTQLSDFTKSFFLKCQRSETLLLTNTQVSNVHKSTSKPGSCE